MKVLKWGIIGLIVLAALFFLLTGRLAWAFMALPALLPWFMRVRALVNTARAFSRMSNAFRSGTNQTSDVETRTLRMTLDHDSGEMTGEVLQGPHGGRRVESLDQAELIDLLVYCKNHDPESERLVESFLDRHFAEWRGAGDSGAGSSTSDNQGPSSSETMDRAEALKILGLEESAGPDDIKEAHRRLIANLHPDHGGTDYLAAKINQAKDLLTKG